MVEDLTTISHNYQSDATQRISDTVLGTSGIIKNAHNYADKNVLFCGVLYMAEDLFVMSGGKANIYIPEIMVTSDLDEIVTPRCPMIFNPYNDPTVSPKDIEFAREKYPTLDQVLVYINTPTPMKSQADGVYNGTLALKVIDKVAEQNNGKGKIAFIGDQNVNYWIFKKVKEKGLEYFEVISIPDNVLCPTHQRINSEEFQKTYEDLTKEHGQIGLSLHPEVPPDLIDWGLEKKAYFGGTGGIVKFATDSSHNTQLVGTVEGAVERIRRENPEKNVISPKAGCKNMAFTTPNRIKRAREILQQEGPIVEIQANHTKPPYYDIKILNKTLFEEYLPAIPAVRLVVNDKFMEGAKKSLSMLL